MAKRSRTFDENGFPKFGMRDKLAYAAGDFGCNMSFALASYLAVFYTQYIGLSASLFALLLIHTQVWDAVNDPLIRRADGRQQKPHKRGKFKAISSSAPSGWSSPRHFASSPSRTRRSG